LETFLCFRYYFVRKGSACLGGEAISVNMFYDAFLGNSKVITLIPLIYDAAKDSINIIEERDFYLSQKATEREAFKIRQASLS
jgi:hypothetical protein